MAKDKKSFLLYCDLIHTVEKLPNEKAGELFKHILNYVNDNDPKTDDLIINISFEPIKQQLKRDLIKYESICKRNKDNGSKGGRPSNPKKPKKPTGIITNPKKPKKADSDNDTDTDNDIDKKNKKNDKIKPLSLHSKLRNIFEDYYFKLTQNKYYWNAKDGTALKTLITKIKFSLNSKEIEQNDEQVINSLNILLLNLPQWYKDNLSMSNISGKYNELITLIKNNYDKSNNSKQGKSIAEQFNQEFGDM